MLPRRERSQWARIAGKRIRRCILAELAVPRRKSDISVNMPNVIIDFIDVVVYTYRRIDFLWSRRLYTSDCLNRVHFYKNIATEISLLVNKTKYAVKADNLFRNHLFSKLNFKKTHSRSYKFFKQYSKNQVNTVRIYLFLTKPSTY